MMKLNMQTCLMELQKVNKAIMKCTMGVKYGKKWAKIELKDFKVLMRERGVGNKIAPLQHKF